MGDESAEHDELWSELRQAALPRFEARLYLERAGLAPVEAVKWWEQHILSAEAARAIAEGRTIDDEVERRRQQMLPGNPHLEQVLEREERDLSLDPPSWLWAATWRQVS